jgi:hypothetical protein
MAIKKATIIEMKWLLHEKIQLYIYKPSIKNLLSMRLLLTYYLDDQAQTGRKPARSLGGNWVEAGCGL